MRLHEGTTRYAYIDAGPTQASATEWGNGEGLTVSLSRSGGREECVSMTWSEWRALCAAVAALEVRDGSV